MNESKTLRILVKRNSKTKGSLSGRMLHIAFTYSHEFQNKIDGSDVNVRIGSTLSSAMEVHGDSLVFIKKPFGGKVLDIVSKHDGDSDIRIKKGFVWHDGNLWTADIEQEKEVKNNGTSVFDTNEWIFSFKITLKECKLPNIGKPVNALNNIYKDSDGNAHTWNEKLLNWEKLSV